jgi:cytochrome P450
LQYGVTGLTEANANDDFHHGTRSRRGSQPSFRHDIDGGTAMGSAKHIDRVGPTGSRPRAASAKRLSTWAMTREALTVGLDDGDGFLGRTRGSDITRFRCAGRRFVSISHPDYVDHVLHEARLKYVKSNEYEPVRAAAGINLLTDEGDSWAAHSRVLKPTFARRHLSGLVDLMIDPITDVADALRTGARFDMHQTMVEAALRVVANSLFSQDFGPLAQSMKDLTTRGLRHAERLERLGLWGLMPRPVYGALRRLASSGVRLPPPLRDMQNIALTLHRAVDSVIDERLEHPTDSADLLNVLLRADGGTWTRRRIRDEALTFMLAGHENTANAMSWFWYLMALHTEARDRMLAEVDDVLGARRAGADDLGRLPWTTACLQESQRYFSSVWIIARRAIQDDVIDGNRIRRGSTVVIPIHHIHHDPRWWADPEAFDPHRFLKGAKDHPRSAYLPFGGGRRICIGQSFASMEMVLIAAIMCQRFTFDLAPDHRVELEATLTLRPKSGLHLIASRRP